MKTVLNRIIQKLIVITRPVRIIISRQCMSKNEKLAISNFHNVSELDKRIINYKVTKEDVLKKKKKVIYTCITGGYDNLIQQSYYNSDYNYICYTDNNEWINQKVIGMWEIRPLVKKDFSNVLNNRWHKTHPHVLFPDYDDSIYIDGNIDIITSYLFEQIKNLQGNLLLPIHFKRKCIYSEIKKLRWNKKISRAQLMNIKNYLKDSGFPKNYGMNENNIIYRKHHEKKIIKIMDEWWKMINDIAPRDQLSLSFVLWKNHISVKDISIENARLREEDFHFYYSEKH